MTIKSPLHWFGGKSHMVNNLIERMPEHGTYVEPFGGGAKLLFAKSPEVSQVEVLNDIDSAVIDFWRAIQNGMDRTILVARWKATWHSRELYHEYLHTWREQEDRLERVYQWFIVARWSFSARFGAGWIFAVKGRSHAITWKNVVDTIHECGERLTRVQIDNKEWSNILDTYDHDKAFFYLDPPYVLSTRRAGGYAHEMSDEDHVRLIERIQTLEGKVMISGYSNPIYDELTWAKEDFEVIASSAGKTRNSNLQGLGAGKAHQTRIESVWTNYDTDKQLPLF